MTPRIRFVSTHQPGKKHAGNKRKNITSSTAMSPIERTLIEQLACGTARSGT